MRDAGVHREGRGQTGGKSSSLDRLTSMLPERPAQGISPLFGVGELGTARKPLLLRPRLLAQPWYSQSRCSICGPSCVLRSSCLVPTIQGPLHFDVPCCKGDSLVTVGQTYSGCSVTRAMTHMGPDVMGPPLLSFPKSKDLYTEMSAKARNLQYLRKGREVRAILYGISLSRGNPGVPGESVIWANSAAGKGTSHGHGQGK